MERKEYILLMQSVSEFSGRIGLNNKKLYRNSYKSTSGEAQFVISVSWKTQLDSSGILCTLRDNLDPQTRFRLEFPVVTGTESEVEAYRKIAEEAGAECFLKQTISSDGFVEPSPSFFRLGEVKQVEYALHEAFHSTSKYFFGREVQQLYSPQEEEASAMIMGHLGAINYFKGSKLENEAVLHWQKHFDLANKITQFYERLEEIYAFRADKDGRPISQEQKLKEREIALLEAEEVIGSALGGPINNAFFLYWNYFYGAVPRVYQRVSGLEDICKVVKVLRGKK